MTRSNLTERTERRAWPAIPEHMIALARLIDDGYTDKITGCHNKSYFLEVIGPQLEASRKFGFPASLVLLEIAHFRQIRYTFGSKIADQILAETAKVIRAKVRSTDLLVRWSDETFGLLLLHANRLGAEVVCRRLRDAVCRHAFPGKASDTMLSVHLGASAQELAFDSAGNDLISAAERALKEAARGNANNLVVHGIPAR